MKIIAPVIVTDDVFVSSAAAENDYAEWNSTTAYAVGDRRIVAAEHRIYEALTAHTNKPPASSPADWLDLGATNRWRMFDNKVGTVTSAVGSLSVTLQPGIVNAIALLGLSAASVQVTMTDTTDGVVFDKTFDLYDPTGITDWWEYFFEDIRRASSLIVDGLPSYRNAMLTVTLTDGPAQTVSLGSLVVGRQHEYAEAVRFGASVGIQDYSRKERDVWGNFQIVERAFSKRARWNFLVANRDIDALQRVLASLRARPAVYIGSDRYDATVLYGFYRDFDTVIAYPTHSECSIEIEGLV